MTAYRCKSWPPPKLALIGAELGMPAEEYLAEAYGYTGSIRAAVRWMVEDSGVSVDYRTAKDWLKQALERDPERMGRFVEDGRSRRREANEAARRNAEMDARRAAAAGGRWCPVCGSPVKSKQRTCGGVCAELWRTCRFHLDRTEWEKHRKQVAAVMLRNGDRSVGHYERVLADEHTADHGRWTYSAAQRERLLDVVALRQSARRLWGELVADLPPIRALEEERPWATCEGCGGEFHPGPDSAGRFCSRSCYLTSGKIGQPANR